MYPAPQKPMVKVREITGRRLWLLIAINDFPSGVIFT
jgi:hypothetical protein